MSANDILPAGSTLDAGSYGKAVLRNADGSLHDSNPAPATDKKDNALAWARFAKNAKAESAKEKDDRDRDDEDDGLDLEDDEQEGDEPDDEPEENNAGDDTDRPIALTGDAVAQFEQRFLESDAFADVPFEHKQAIVAFAKSMLRSNATLSEEEAVEHLRDFIGIDEAVAKKLVDAQLG